LEPAQEPGELGCIGHYRVLKLLGQGGMGLVFLADDPRLQRRVAVKVMRPELATDAIARQRFLREARATATIHSDHIVTIHEIGQVNDVPYLVTEFLDGQSLEAAMRDHPRMTLDQLLDLGIQIALGLEAAHQCGVIHRDIKPSNIWVDPTGRIKILDFGLARPAQASTGLTEDGVLLGTPAYMPPEQADGKPVDQRCDLFSLGCVLYEASTGNRPFDGSSPLMILKATALTDPAALEELNPALPAAFTDLVMRLLAKDPQRRPASATEVLKTLVAIGDEPAPPAQPGPSDSNSRRITTSPPRPGGTRRLALGVGLTGLTVLSLVLAITGVPQFNSGTPPEAMSGNDPGKEKRLQPHWTAQGVSDQEVLLGMSAPFSGPARELGRDMEVGVRAYFRQVDDEGGIAGRKVNLVVLDDGYQPERALANMQELYEQRKVFAVIGNVGTPTAEQTMPYALSRKMIFFGAFTGAPLLRKDPPDRYVFNFRASYAEETAAIVKHLVEIKGIRPEQIAVLAQQDGYGDAGFNGVVKMLRKYGRQPDELLRVGHARNSDDVSAAVQTILGHKEIRAVVMVSTYRPASQFIRQLKDAKVDLVFANVSFVGANALAEELHQIHPDYAAGVIVTQVVPHPASQSTLVSKYRQALWKYYPNEKANFGSLEGYLNAIAFAEGLRRAGENLTTETLVDALESIRNLDVGLGTPLHYGPSEHQASHKVWATVLDGSGGYQVLDLE